MLSEINPFDLSVISEFLRSAGSKNRSVVDDISAVSDLQGFSDIVISYKNPDLLGFQMINDPLNLQYGDRINPGKRLVQQHKFGRNDQRSGYFHAASLATRKRVGETFSYVTDPKFLEQVFHSLASFLSRERQCLENGHEIGLNG